MDRRIVDVSRPTDRAVKAVEDGCRRATAEGRAPRLLFVCLGNICRSPAAQGITEALAAKRGIDVDCDSAGFYGGHAGDLPDRRMRKAAAERGYTLDHRARKIKGTDLDDFDVVMGMDDSNMDDLEGLAYTDERADKLVRMSDFAADHPTYRSVPDPYYGGSAGFTLVLDLLEDACSHLLDQIAKNTPKTSKE